MIALTDPITLPSDRSFFFSLKTKFILSQQVPTFPPANPSKMIYKILFYNNILPFFFLSNTLN